MCLNGIVFPNLSWKPAAYEVKNSQSPIKIEYKFVHSRLKGYIIKNNYLSINLSHLRITWELQCDGKIVDSGELKQYCTPPGEFEFLDYQLNMEKISGESFINIKAVLRENTAYAKEGDVIYACQFPLEQSVIKKQEVCLDGEKIIMSENADEICILGQNTEICFNKSKCNFTKVVLEGKDIFFGSSDNFYRAPTGIDEGIKDSITNYAADWRAEGLEDLKINVHKIATAASDTQIFIFTDVSYNNEKLIVSTQYRIGSKGIEINKTVINNCVSKTIPRIGLTFVLPKDKNQVTWYGRGPWENYSDRKESAQIGCYNSTVSEQYTPYIKPVECGGKEDVRYLIIRDERNHSVRVSGAVPFHFDIHDYSITACDKANYEEELIKDNHIYLNIDHIHAGLGGDTGWTKSIHPEYCIGKGYYNYKIAIEVL